MPDSVSTTAPAASIVPAESGTSLSRDAWLRLSKNRLAMICLYVFGAIVAMCLFLPLLPGHEPNRTHLDERGLSPSFSHLLGTDHLGRDLFERILEGGRVSLMVGFVATAVSIFIGVIYGTIAGYVGGKVDTLMMRVVDVLYALPFIIIVILLTTLFGNKLWLIFLAIGLVEWLTMARIVRGQIMSLKNQEFSEAAVSLGLNPWHIMFRHLLPNTIGPIIVYATLTVPAVMLLESVLSFLGLGVQPPHSSWGTLIKEGADRFTGSPWSLIFPAIFFSTTLFCLNFLGDGLRDAFDPKSSKD